MLLTSWQGRQTGAKGYRGCPKTKCSVVEQMAINYVGDKQIEAREGEKGKQPCYKLLRLFVARVCYG